MIHPGIVDACTFIIDSSGVVDLLLSAMNRGPRGRKQNRQAYRLLLIGGLLSIYDGRGFVITHIYNVLRHRLDLPTQLELGFATHATDENGTETVKLVPKSQLDFAIESIDKYLAYGEGSAAGVSAEERARRHRAVCRAVDAIFDVFLFAWPSATYAIDETGVWAWTKGRKRKGRKKATADPAGPVEEGEMKGIPMATEYDHDGNPLPPLPIEPPRDGRLDKDAQWGYKTAKFGGVEIGFGYHEGTAVLVADEFKPRGSVPNLVIRTELVPASQDLVDPTLRLIDRLPQVKSVIVDRGYSYKAADRWWDGLMERGVTATIDLCKGDHGFTDLDGTRWAAGWAHCPATPDHLGTIPRPGPAGRKDNPAKYKADMEAFRQRIDERRQYALHRITSPGPGGRARWKCPALQGTVGCPLREGTVEVAVQLGQPVVNAPKPTDPALPKCCTQSSVLLEPGPLRKLMQPRYWGSHKWARQYAKRNAVETNYGKRKNPSMERMDREYCRLINITRNYIAYSLAAVVQNIRTLRRWYAFHHDLGPDPVLDEDPINRIEAPDDGPDEDDVVEEDEEECTERYPLPPDHPLHSSVLVARRERPYFRSITDEEAVQLAKDHRASRHVSSEDHDDKLCA